MDCIGLSQIFVESNSNPSIKCIDDNVSDDKPDIYPEVEPRLGAAL